MSSRLRMVHLRTVPDAWHARVLAARLGCEGIVTQLRGNVSGPYPFGEVSVLVEEEQAQLAADLLLADEVESAFGWPDPWVSPLSEPEARGLGDLTPFGADDLSALCAEIECLAPAAVAGDEEEVGAGSDHKTGRHKPRARWQRVLAAAAAIIVAGAPLLTHFAG
ncbi:MAG TPA: hypothetical protein VK425_05115 [Acidimicrobiales bacterium]|nr:hypothetical protein [Acidimicrobiales bacterium]